MHIWTNFNLLLLNNLQTHAKVRKVLTINGRTELILWVTDLLGFNITNILYWQVFFKNSLKALMCNSMFDLHTYLYKLGYGYLYVRVHMCV
jgi:hypothetical protein